MGTATSHAMESSRTRSRARWGKVALAGWAFTAFLVTGSLASAHLYTLPSPPKVKPELVQALAAHRLPADRGRFAVSHVLYAACRCSQRIVDHLATRRARKDVSESVLLVGEDQPLIARLSGAGFRVDVLTPRNLRERFAIQSAPLLIIAQPDDRIAYLGGYTDHKQSLPIRDGELIDKLLRGAAAPELPLFGCATSRALQRMLDPFALKYPLFGSDDDV